MNTLNGSRDAFIIDFQHKISRHDLRTHTSSRCDASAPYPPLEDVVCCIKNNQHHDKALPDLYNNDALFCLAIRAHFNQIGRAKARERCYRALRRAISMGICDWDAQEKNVVAAKSFFPV